MSEGSASDNSDNSNASSSSTAKKRKLSYKQKYKEAWEKEFSWISKNKKGPYYAWCKSCNCDVKISHGKNDLLKHSSTTKHKKSSQSIVGQKSISEMFQRKGVDLEAKAKEADIRIAGFIAEHNLSFKLMEHLPALISSVCTDSNIAKKN